MLDIDPYTGRERTPSPGLAMLRSIGQRTRRVRSGLAQTQMLILLGVIAAIIVLGIGGFAIYRSVTSGSQDTATKQNIDRVALALENYWQQFAADRYGVSDIDLVEACNYLNAQFTQQEDLNIRTLAVVDNTAAVTLASTATGGTAELANFPAANDGLAQRVAYLDQPASAVNAQANCPLDNTGLERAATADVIVGLGAGDIDGSATAVAVPATGQQAWPASVTADEAPGLDDFAAAGFSQQSVWIMQPVGFGGAAGVAPPGTKVGGSSPNPMDNNEVLVIGGVSPSGNSYCLIKVFNASNRTFIGDYRFAHTYDGSTTGTAGTGRMAVCTQGTDGNPPTGMTRNAGWPG